MKMTVKFNDRRCYLTLWIIYAVISLREAAESQNDLVPRNQTDVGEDDHTLEQTPSTQTIVIASSCSGVGVIAVIIAACKLLKYKGPCHMKMILCNQCCHRHQKSDSQNTNSSYSSNRQSTGQVMSYNSSTAGGSLSIESILKKFSFDHFCSTNNRSGERVREVAVKNVKHGDDEFEYSFTKVNKTKAPELSVAGNLF